MATIRLYFESMAGTHLLDGIDALRNAGSADALYGEEVRHDPRHALSVADVDIAEQVARGRQMAYSRHALLFAAFSAEGYINDFLFEHVPRSPDRDALLKMSTVDKYIFLPQIVQGKATFERGHAPWNMLRWLFRRRDELVHSKPGSGLGLVGEDPEIHNPKKAADAILAVAEAAVRLGEEPGSIAGTVHRMQRELLAFANRATGKLPRIDDAPVAFWTSPVFVDSRGLVSPGQFWLLLERVSFSNWVGESIPSVECRRRGL